METCEMVHTTHYAVWVLLVLCVSSTLTEGFVILLSFRKIRAHYLKNKPVLLSTGTD